MVFIRTVDGRVLSLSIEAQATVAQLQARLEDAEGIPTRHQALFLSPSSKQPLSPSRTLHESDVSTDQTLLLRVKDLNGGDGEVAKITMCACCVFFLVFIILLLSGLKKIDATEVALRYSSNSQTLDCDEYYTPGLKLIGPGQRFIKFPSENNEQNIEFRGSNLVEARTIDGISIFISAKLFYKLPSNVKTLCNLHLMFEESYPQAFTRIARDEIRDAASLRTAFDFWADRPEVETLMRSKLVTAFKDWFADISDFKLENFDLPNDFEAAVEKTDETRQEREKVQEEEAIAVTQTSTKIEAAKQTVEVILFEANQTATATQLEFDAKIQAVAFEIGAETEAYDQLQQTMDFNNDEINTFAWLYGFRTAPNLRATMKLDVPSELEV
jgi:hypothetical protein